MRIIWKKWEFAVLFCCFHFRHKILLEIYWYYSFKLLLFHDYNLGL